MADIDLTRITEPVADDAPCGPDLDMEFDMDFMNFMAGIEGHLPTSFFAFDASELDFDAYYGQIGGFLERTRDVRLLVPLAKLYVLQGRVGEFAAVLDALHRLLKEQWSDVHPQPMDGDFELRMAYLFPLDDMPNSVLPFQHAPLVRTRRAGGLSLRKWQVATGDVNPREGEDTPDRTGFAQAFGEAEPDDVARVRQSLETARDALAGIRLVCIEEAGFDAAVSFERLPKAIDDALAMIAEHAGADEPAADDEAAGPGDGAPAGPVAAALPAGAIATREDAIEAMHVAARYFAMSEPASPVPMILREAQTAASKGFYELVNDLVPDFAGSATLSLGQDPFFEVSLYTLDQRNPSPDYETGEPAEDADAWESAGLGDDEISAADEPPDEGAWETGDANDWPEDTPDDPDAGDANDLPGDEANEAANDLPEDTANDAPDDVPDDTANDAPEDVANDVPDEAAADAWDDTANDAPDDVDAEAAGDDAGETGLAPRYTASTRPEAIALIDRVLAYYRVAEPSSPVPLLLERAKAMATMSFIDILNQILPDGSLKGVAKEGEDGGSW